VVELLLQGYDNQAIADALHMAERTVKNHFSRLFLRYGITGGIKRVKLAVMLYKAQLEEGDLNENSSVTPAPDLNHSLR